MKRFKTCFFTIVDDRYYYPIGTHIMANSFKRFHPNIDLIVFRQDMIDKVFKEKGINFYQAKPTFAKLLVEKYDRIINIDADTIILARLDEVLDTQWDFGAVWNYNDYENASFSTIMPEMYVQAGMVGATNPRFWDIWEEQNKKAMDYVRQENDVLNIVWYKHPYTRRMDRLIWDRAENYLGCKSLGREAEFYIENGKVMCRDEQVKAYHWARGGRNLPKMDWEQLPLSEEVKIYFNDVGTKGITKYYGKFL